VRDNQKKTTGKRKRKEIVNKRFYEGVEHNSSWSKLERWIGKGDFFSSFDPQRSARKKSGGGEAFLETAAKKGS